MQDARNLIRYGGNAGQSAAYFQFDCALSYSLVEYLRTLGMLRDNGWSAPPVVPHGGHQMWLEYHRGPGPRRQQFPTQGIFPARDSAASPKTSRSPTATPPCPIPQA